MQILPAMILSGIVFAYSATTASLPSNNSLDQLHFWADISTGETFFYAFDRSEKPFTFTMQHPVPGATSYNLGDLTARYMNMPYSLQRPYRKVEYFQAVSKTVKAGVWKSIVNLTLSQDEYKAAKKDSLHWGDLHKTHVDPWIALSIIKDRSDVPHQLKYSQWNRVTLLAGIVEGNRDFGWIFDCPAVGRMFYGLTSKRIHYDLASGSSDTTNATAEPWSRKPETVFNMTGPSATS